MARDQIQFFGDLAFTPDFFESTFESVGVSHVNLEAPLIPKGETLPLLRKVGPHLQQLPDLINSPMFSNFTYSLANNHTMDFGESGLRSTLLNLPTGSWSGAGFSLEEAREPLIIQLGPVLIGIISCSDVFFGAADSRSGGTASVSSENDWVASLISRLRDRKIVPIVSFHGGLEDSTVPSPLIVRRFRGWVDAGAETVLGHHPHVPLPSEKYNGKWIFYGLGNFLVNVSKWRDTHPLSLISRRVIIHVHGNGVTAESHHVQLSQLPSSDGLRYMSSRVSEEIESELSKYFDGILSLVSDKEKFGEAFDFLAYDFAKNFARRQLLLGSVGNFLPQPWRKEISKETRRGLFARKFQQAFGPHLEDLFQGEVSRDLLLRGLELLPGKQPGAFDDFAALIDVSKFPSLRKLC